MNGVLGPICQSRLGGNVAVGSGRVGQAVVVGFAAQHVVSINVIVLEGGWTGVEPLESNRVESDQVVAIAGKSLCPVNGRPGIPQNGVVDNAGSAAIRSKQGDSTASGRAVGRNDVVHDDRRADCALNEILIEISRRGINAAANTDLYFHSGPVPFDDVIDDDRVAVLPTAYAPELRAARFPKMWLNPISGDEPSIAMPAPSPFPPREMFW